MNVEETVSLLRLSLLLGGLVPILVSFLKRQEWSDSIKKTVAFVVSAGTAVISVAVEMGLSLNSGEDWLNLALSLVAVIGVAQTTYAQFWTGPLAPIENALAKVKVLPAGTGSGKLERQYAA